MPNVSVNIRKRSSGSWQIRFRSKGKKEVSITLSGTLSRREVERKRALYEHDISMGMFDPWDQTPETPYLKQLIEEYIAYKVKYRWNKTTADGQIIRLNQMLDFYGNIPVDAVHHWEWYEQPGWSAATKRGFFITTRAFLKWCEKNRYHEYPDLELKRETAVKASQKKLKAITLTQLHDICNAYRWQDYVNKRHGYAKPDSDPERHIQLWHVAFRLLARKAELEKVTIHDVEGDYITLDRKGGKKQRLYIYSALRPHIDWFLKNQLPGQPFFGFANLHYPGKVLRRVAKMAIGEFEGSYGFHMLRHGGITHMIYEGIDIGTISEYAGHSTVSITLDRYSHVFKDESVRRLDKL